MRFKNYKNPYTNDNRIYSFKDLYDMPFGEVIRNKQEVLGQYRILGVPTEKELQGSENVIWVDAYTRDDGTEVKGHWRCRPEYSPILSTGIQEEKVHNRIFVNIPNDKINESIDNFIQEPEKSKEINQLLEGRVEKNYGLFDRAKDTVLEQVDDIKTKIEDTEKKYEGLSPTVAAQKAASKLLGDNMVENEFYRNSLKMKDGESLTDKFKEENDIYTLKDITDPEKSKYYKEQLAKMYGYDINDPETDEKLKDKKIVIPKEGSRLYQYAKNSEAMEIWIVDNYDKIKNGEIYDDKIEFPSTINDSASRGLYATIHKANANNVKINEDNSMSIDLSDKYDFAKWDKHKWDKQESIKNNLYKKGIVNINNNAYEQQENKQLENFLISMQLHYTKEELEELMKKYKRRK